MHSGRHGLRCKNRSFGTLDPPSFEGRDLEGRISSPVCEALPTVGTTALKDHIKSPSLGCIGFRHGFALRLSRL